MGDYAIAQQRRESFLQEIIAEALGNLNDHRLNGLHVTMVKCSRGKHNAVVFIEASSMSKEDMQSILNAFNKARPLIQEYIRSVTTWHNCPKLSIEFDKSLQAQNNLDRIFSIIHAQKNNSNQ